MCFRKNLSVVQIKTSVQLKMCRNQVVDSFALLHIKDADRHVTMDQVFLSLTVVIL